MRNVGWEIKKIEEIATDIYSGSEITKVQLDSGNYPAIKFIGKSTKNILYNGEEFVDLNLIKKKKYCEYGDILFSKFNQIKEIAGKSALYLGKEKCLVGGAITIFKHNQNPKYLSYFLSTHNSRNQINSLLQRGIVFQMYPKNVKKIKIPLPSLEEQERIVKTLDKLYDICENPDKGIQLLIKNNRKQYEYYKELIFEEIIKTAEKEK